MKTGFNWGTLQHNAQLAFENDGYLPNATIDQIKKNTPESMLRHARFSGSAGNTTLISEAGYGKKGGRWDAECKSKGKKSPTLSYIYAGVKTYQQLGCTDMCYTLPVHNAFLGYNTLTEVIDSLKYMMSRTNVICVSLGNENYLQPHVLGASGTPNVFERLALVNNNIIAALSNAKVNDAFRKKVIAYLDYLEYKVVPALRAAGYKGPIALDTHVNTTACWKIWNQEVLKRNFYDILTPHLYAVGTDIASIQREFTLHFDELSLHKKGKMIWVTEFGLSSKATERMKSRTEVDLFIANFEKLFKKYGVTRAYYHTLWNEKPTVYTYIK